MAHWLRSLPGFWGGDGYSTPRGTETPMDQAETRRMETVGDLPFLRGPSGNRGAVEVRGLRRDARCPADRPQNENRDFGSAHSEPPEPTSQYGATMKRYTPDDLNAVLDAHQKWLDGEDGGIRANLSQVWAGMVDRCSLRRAHQRCPGCSRRLGSDPQPVILSICTTLERPL